MALSTVKIGSYDVSRLIVGGNPFSGGSHKDAQTSKEMRDYYTVARIKEVLHKCEACGINTFVGRADNHIMRTLNEFWNEGGKLRWFAQTAPERASLENNVRAAKANGASACFLHGGMVDRMFEEGTREELRDYIKFTKDQGLLAGTATHNPNVPLHFEEHDFGAEFYMMCFYDLPARSGDMALRSHDDRFVEEDRDKAVGTIKAVKKPCLAYKILAAGRNNPEQAFRFAFANIKPTDAVVVGIYTKHQATQVEDDVRLTERITADMASK